MVCESKYSVNEALSPEIQQTQAWVGERLWKKTYASASQAISLIECHLIARVNHLYEAESAVQKGTFFFISYSVKCLEILTNV